MDYKAAIEGLSNRFPSRLITIDSHTAGESTRLIISGAGPVPGQTMKESIVTLRKTWIIFGSR